MNDLSIRATSRRPALRLAALVAGLALVLAACSSGSTTTSTATTEPAASGAVANPPPQTRYC